MTFESLPIRGYFLAKQGYGLTPPPFGQCPKENVFLSTDVFPQCVSVANYGELLSQRVEDLTKKAVLSQSGANWTNEQTSRPSRSCQWRQHHFSTKDVQTNTIHKHCAGYSVCNVFEATLGIV